MTSEQEQVANILSTSHRDGHKDKLQKKDSLLNAHTTVGKTNIAGALRGTQFTHDKQKSV
jgi:hypothetical protein